MTKNLTRLLTDARNKGIDYGIKGMAMMAIIAADNVLQDYFEDRTERKKVLNEIDTEMLRVWETFKEESIKKNADIGTVIVGWYERMLTDDTE